MSMTEETAKTKWCPFASPLAIHPYAYIGKDGSKCISKVEGRKCIASECMLWRWDERQTARPGPIPVTGRAKPVIGYCGMAPRPQ